MNKNHEMFMKMAINEAYKGLDKGELPFGCCLVFNDDVIVTHNTCLSEHSLFAHAEMIAIIKMCEKHSCLSLEGATLYATTEPCLMCMGAISWAKISCVVFGANIKNSCDVGFKEVSLTASQISSYMPHNIKLIPNYMKNECEGLLLEWKKKSDIFQRVYFNNKGKNSFLETESGKINGCEG